MKWNEIWWWIDRRGLKKEDVDVCSSSVSWVAVQLRMSLASR